MPITDLLTRAQAEALAATHATPLFVYSSARLKAQARQMCALPAPFGLTVRYAMKANPHPEVLRLFRGQGVKIDASSAYEAEAAMAAGYAPADILLTSQQLAHNLPELVEAGVQFNATSLHQLEAYGAAFPGRRVSVRLNPGIGSGHSAKTNVGGPASSFGIWHDYIDRVHETARRHRLRIDRLHTHIGSGTDPTVWRQVAQISLELVRQFPDVTTINLGGGFKVARMAHEHATDVAAIGQVLARELSAFEAREGRRLHLELEPGTFLTANAGALLTRVDDITDTGDDGFTFLKVDAGMTEILRPSLYGAQHPITVLNESNEQDDYVVVGHCCESGDLLTPAPGEPEMLSARRLNRAQIGDLVLVGGAGAYCASMAAHGYNGYPPAAEVVI